MPWIIAILLLAWGAREVQSFRKAQGQKKAQAIAAEARMKPLPLLTSGFMFACSGCGQLLDGTEETAFLQSLKYPTDRTVVVALFRNQHPTRKSWPSDFKAFHHHCVLPFDIPELIQQKIRFRLLSLPVDVDYVQWFKPSEMIVWHPINKSVSSRQVNIVNAAIMDTLQKELKMDDLALDYTRNTILQIPA